METLIQASYFIVAVIFIVGLKQMSSPVTARRGILWAGAAMVLATIVTFLAPQIIGYIIQDHVRRPSNELLHSIKDIHHSFLFPFRRIELIGKLSFSLLQPFIASAICFTALWEVGKSSHGTRFLKNLETLSLT